MEHFKENFIVWRRLGVNIVIVHVATMKIYVATIQEFKKNKRGKFLRMKNFCLKF